MNVTFRPIIIQGNKRQDGTWPVKIRVTFRGTVRRLPTNLVCYASDLTRSGRIKSPSVLERAQQIVDRMRGAIADLDPFQLETMDVDGIVRRIRDRLTAQDFQLDFFAFGYAYVAETKTGGTRTNYETALRSFARYLGSDHLDVNAITRAMLLDFRASLDAQPRMVWSKTTRSVVPSSVMPRPLGNASRIISRLAHIFSAARDRYNDEDAGRILIPRTPFSGIPKPQPAPEGQRNIGTESVQRIIDAALTEDGALGAALCAFVVSFGLMGANIADLFRATPVGPGSVWSYRRRKTETRRADHAQMRVRVPEVLAPFLARLGAGTSKEWWLPGLRGNATDKDGATRVVNRNLRAWAKAQQLPAFTFYAARHSWASIARAQGVEKATIDDCLCHKGDFQVADIYAEKAWHLMDAANAKVLALFRWPTTGAADPPAGGSR